MSDKTEYIILLLVCALAIGLAWWLLPEYHAGQPIQAFKGICHVPFYCNVTAPVDGYCTVVSDC